ncbi:MAG: aldo/keto reductase [Planctomycetes bacterium]|nr:aldo/keto reductase [Planctomycetota bacterium]MBI3846453.1 aldo/keto reductase [Planctomycetota bacterium]
MTPSRKLGRSGLEVSEVGFGGFPVASGIYGPTDDDVSLAALRRALELGCTFFDTADVYGDGHGERLLRRALGDRIRSVVIATKAGKAFDDGLGFEPERLRQSLDGSLERLGVAGLGLFQLHDPPASAIRDPRVHDLMRQWKSTGRIRAAGVSVESVADGMAALACGAWDAIQVEVNLFISAALRELIPLAAERGVGIVVKRPLDHGMLSGKYGADARFGPGDARGHVPPDELAWRARAVERLQFLWQETGRTPVQAALRFILDQAGVSTVIPGIKTPAQAEEAFACVDVPRLTEAERTRLRREQDAGWR